MDVLATMTDEDIQSNIWAEFLKHRSEIRRGKLIAYYEDYANMLAAKFYAQRQIDEIEFHEFKQYALVGLIESIDRYDPSKEASFKTFSAYRIKGAILSGVEKYSEKQQQIATRTRLKQERLKSLSAEPKADTDIFVQMMDLTLGLAIGYMLEGSGMYQSEEQQDVNVYKSRELRDLVKVVTRLVETLPEAEEKVIRYHYFQELSFAQIAEMMKITKGRISQIHRSALQRMTQHHDELKLLRTDY